MASRKTMLAAEIQRKVANLSEEELELSNGSHTLYTHCGLSDDDLKRRSRETQKKEVSTFFSRELILEALQDYVNDPLGIEDLVNWLQDPAPRHECKGCIFVGDDVKVLGRVCYKDGNIEDASGYTLILGCRETGYYNKITNLPFDVITAYVEN